MQFINSRIMHLNRQHNQTTGLSKPLSTVLFDYVRVNQKIEMMIFLTQMTVSCPVQAKGSPSAFNPVQFMKNLNKASIKKDYFLIFIKHHYLTYATPAL